MKNPVMKTKQLAADTVINVVFTIYALSCIVPLILLVSVSFTSEASLINNGYKFIPEVFSTKAYTFLIKEPTLMLRAYGITIVTALAGTIVYIFTNSMYAYTLSRRDFPYRKFFSLLVLITLIFSGGLPPFYYIYVRVLHVKNNILSMILPGLMGGFGGGLSIFIMRTFFIHNVPNEIIESAKIDGAGETRTFFKIVLPLSLPILATFSLFSIIFYWNDFLNCMLFIDNPELYNLQYSMQKALMNLEFLKTGLLSRAGANASTVFASQIPGEGVRMAMVVFAVGPIILAYPFFQKYFVKGLTMGAVKG